MIEIAKIPVHKSLNTNDIVNEAQEKGTSVIGIAKPLPNRQADMILEESTRFTPQLDEKNMRYRIQYVDVNGKKKGSDFKYKRHFNAFQKAGASEEESLKRAKLRSYREACEFRLTLLNQLIK